MTRAIVSAALLILAFVGLVAQEPDPSRHDRYKDDPHAYCLPSAPLPEDQHGHECACKLVCVDPQQPPAEDATCAMYCSRSRCVCHADKGCPGEM